jgi:C-terminal processing protease CtpA/Prc
VARVRPPRLASDGALLVKGDPVPIESDEPEQQVDLGVPAGAVAGVGARIRALGDGVRVEWVIAGGPADRGGLGPGDLVLEVDGTPTAGISTSDFLRLATGPEGSVVTYRVRFVEGHTDEVRMTRQRIPADWASRRGQGELWDPSPFEAAGQ